MLHITQREILHVQTWPLRIWLSHDLYVLDYMVLQAVSKGVSFKLDSATYMRDLLQDFQLSLKVNRFHDRFLREYNRSSDCSFDCVIPLKAQCPNSTVDSEQVVLSLMGATLMHTSHASLG